ncbi:MAG: phosphatase PAP2 family protein, partial [Flavobacteriales bacterium]|nr:phosphatase PAP2 family protein [Flavobacteriales bacterium]
MKQIGRLVIAALLLLTQSLTFSAYAFVQPDTLLKESPYSLNYKIDIPITLAALIGNSLGLSLIKKNNRIDDPTEITSLDPGKVPKFDRSSLSLDHTFFEKAHDLSNIGLNVGTILPALLFLDKDMRADWLPLTVLYFESTLVFANVYVWGAATPVARYRPFLYYDEIPIEERMGDFRKNSFFSGHASFTAVASFYIATTYSAYHKSANKLLLYSLATIPPAFVSYYRYKAGKHFPSDVIVGTFVGAIGGVLVPYLHRVNKNRKNKSLTINPI